MDSPWGRIKKQLAPILRISLEAVNHRFNEYESASFRRYYEGHRRIVRAAVGMSPLPRAEIWPWETKSGGARLAQSLGISQIPIIEGPVSIDLVAWETLPEQFVLKSDTGTAGAGVYVLRRRGERFEDLIRGGDLLSISQICDDFSKKHARNIIDAECVVAERALIQEGAVVPDYKVFAFQGKIGLIEQIARSAGGRKFRFYDADWRDLGTVNSRATSTALAPPVRGYELLRAAKELSLLLPLPFIRIDLYEYRDQVYFGEITQTPGGDHRYVRSLDRRLGELWEEASASLALKL